MGVPREALESQVLQLPTSERVRLLDRVVASLDADAARDAAWNKVAVDREAQAEMDPSVMLNLDPVLDRLRAELK